MKIEHRQWMMIALLVGLLAVGLTTLAQEAAPAEKAAAPAGEAAGAEEETAAQPQGLSFVRVVTGSGILGIILWLGLLACSVAGTALIVDSLITIRAKKIVPQTLVEAVREAMAQGDIVKALKHCEEEPGPLANILSAGFSNVQEGFEAVQDAVGVAAEMESEKLLQRVTYLNVVGSLAPMLGLLGTVQGMIYAFATLGTQQAGAAQQAMLALNISQALFTTAAGLSIAVPTLGFFYYFRNRAAKIILGMEAMTLDLIKSLRNVEVVEE